VTNGASGPVESVARVLSTAPPTGSAAGPMVLIHPGALPASHYDAMTAALPDRAVVLVDLERVPAYVQGALNGGLPRITLDELLTLVRSSILSTLDDVGASADRWMLAGWSFGGVLAHCLVGRLEPTQRPTSLLLIDSIAPVPRFLDRTDSIAADLVLGWFAMYLAAKRGVPLPVPNGAADLDAILQAGLASGTLRPGTTLPGLAKLFQAYTDGLRRNNRLVRDHHPEPVTVPVTLLRPDRGLLADPGALGWESLANDLRIVPCPGDHYTVLRDRTAIAELRRIADAHAASVAA